MFEFFAAHLCSSVREWAQNPVDANGDTPKSPLSGRLSSIAELEYLRSIVRSQMNQKVSLIAQVHLVFPKAAAVVIRDTSLKLLLLLLLDVAVRGVARGQGHAIGSVYRLGDAVLWLPWTLNAFTNYGLRAGRITKL